VRSGSVVLLTSLALLASALVGELIFHRDKGR
jgi:hypothetical protein